jgi:PilZ domain
MVTDQKFRESRRSTRVPLKIDIKVERSGETVICQGETVVVNLHGALISTSTALKIGLRISIYVVLTSKQSAARVVYADRENPLQYGIELEKPQNIWGVSLPPEDWEEATAFGSF